VKSAAAQVAYCQNPGPHQTTGDASGVRSFLFQDAALETEALGVIEECEEQMMLEAAAPRRLERQAAAEFVHEPGMPAANGEQPIDLVALSAATMPCPRADAIAALMERAAARLSRPG
jgi:hypothetical protein